MSEVIIREIKEDDLWNGFLKSLDSLKQASSIEKSKAKEIFEKINANPDHIIAVAELDGKIVGSTTLLIESKFIHDGGLVGHIEDVVVNKEYQGQKIGVVSNTKSLEIMQGSTLDYVEELHSSRFVVQNPNAEASCGCGISFCIK